MVSSIVLMTVLTAGAPPVLTTAPAKIHGLGRQSRGCGGRASRGCGGNNGCGTVVYAQPTCGTVCQTPVTPCAPVVHSAPVVHAAPVVHSAPVVSYSVPLMHHTPVMSGCAGGSCGMPVYSMPSYGFGGFSSGCSGGRCR